MKKAFILFGLIVLVFLAMCTGTKTGYVAKVVNPDAGKIVKEPNAAGSFYPSDETQLRNMINSFSSEVDYKKLENIGKVRGLVLPHAGYIYSGPVASYGFEAIKGKNYRTVIIIGPSHYIHFDGFSIPNATHYKTPLGLINISQKANGLKKEKFFMDSDAVHSQEHSVEVMLPFLQEVLGNNFEIIPIVMGNAMEPVILASILLRYINEDTLVIASSDLSHYKDYTTAVKLDNYCTETIPDLNFTLVSKCDACGIRPILTLVVIANELRWNGKLLDYRNSGDTQGTEKVVGYSSIAFYEGLSKSEKKLLLDLANDILYYNLKGDTLLEFEINEDDLSGGLKKVQGCFVTLYKNGQLRGCIGHIIPQESLYKCVMDNALNAALHDSRFNPVGFDELNDIEIEISVLSSPEDLHYASSDDLLNKLRPFVDGVVLSEGFHQSTYLPLVWEQMPDKELFLTSLCTKGGMSPDCWKKGVHVKTYQAFAFKE